MLSAAAEAAGATPPENLKLPNCCFSDRSLRHFPSASLVTEISFGLGLAYPAGDGSLAILRRMLPNSRRVRWLSASSSQKYLACLISPPPVFTGRYCRLVNDQCLIR